MAEVTIKAYSRRGIGGKTIQVRSYTRRIGRKGIRSPKRTKEKPGEEFEKKVEETIQKPTITKEELERRKKWEKDFAEVENARKSLGMTREQYSNYLLKQRNKPIQKQYITTTSRQTVRRKSKGLFDKIEDRIAKFVEKYSGKKYKR